MIFNESACSIKRSDLLLCLFLLYIPIFQLSCFPSHSLSSWECVRCTRVNDVQAVLCMSCECPRLASAVPVGFEESAQSSTITGYPATCVSFIYANMSKKIKTVHFHLLCHVVSVKSQICIAVYSTSLLFAPSLRVAVPELYRDEPWQQCVVYRV